MTPLRINIVAPEFPPDIGGVETYSYELAREVARRGHAVVVFTSRHRQGEVVGDGFVVRPELRLRRRWDRQLLRRYPAEVWHVTNAAYAWMALEAEGVVVSVHGNDFLRPYCLVGRPDLQRWAPPPLRRRLDGFDRAVGERRTRRWMARGLVRARRIITNSRYTEQILMNRIPACGGRTTAALVGLSPEMMALPVPPGRRPGTARLITVARLSEPRKCIDRVIDALALLQGRFNFTYEVVGDGPLREPLEARAAAAGIGDRVTFSGFLPRADLLDHLAASDLFILTSDVLATSHEGFGIAYLEANACGLPILACRSGGAVEAVEEGVSGIFVERPEANEIAAAVARVVSGEQTFDPAACQAFARGFSWTRVVDCIEPFYVG